MANDVAISIGKGQAIEKIVVDASADTALTACTVTFSTSLFATKEDFVRALTEILDYSEGIVWPPVDKAAAP